MDRPRGDYGDPYNRQPHHYHSDDFYCPPRHQPYGDYPDQHYFNGYDPHFDHHHHHHSHHNNSNDNNHHHRPMSNDFNDPFYGGDGAFHPHSNIGGGHSVPFSGRKREHPDGVNFAKLYVSPVPRTAVEEDIRPLFEQHGCIVEVVLLRDKRTGQQQGSCFVKYATIEDADRAIRALNDNYTFPGEVAPIKVRYADGERERLGAIVDKLYVGGVHKQASKREIEEIFSPYGVVEDVFIARDELKKSRGYAFVKYSHRDMAVAAIKALNGSFTMRGCDVPLIVRFADPKKPRNGEPRPMQHFGESMGGSLAPMAPISKQQVSTCPQPVAVSPVVNRGTAVDSMMRKAFPAMEQTSLLLSRDTSQLAQTPEVANASQISVPEAQKPPHMLPQPVKKEQHQSCHVTIQESPEPQDNLRTVPSTSTSSSILIEVEDLECDWSQHVCPDGFKYYYNCATFESTWEKPDDYARYEQEVEKRQKQRTFCEQINSSSPKFSTQTSSHTHSLQLSETLFQQDIKEPLSAVEKVHSETATIIGPTCV